MLPDPLHDTAIFMEVDVATWRAVLDGYGEADRLAGQTFTSQDLMASLLSGDVQPQFYSALELIQELGTDDGRAHIEQLASDQGIALRLSASDVPAREFVAQLVLLASTEQGINGLLQIAQFTLRTVGSSRTYREYVGKSSSDDVEVDVSKLKEEIERWCREHGKSDVVTAHAHFLNDEWYCHIVRGDAVKRVLEVKGQAVVPLQYRPAATDLLRYDPKTGRIGIATRYGQMLQGYRAILGNCFAGDEQFFAGENICSLKPLQHQRSGLFSQERLPQGIRSVDTVELLWRRGERDRVWVKGRDCFKILNDLGATLEEGEVFEAKLSVAFASGGRPGLVSLKVPNIIDIKAGRNVSLIERLLDSVGIRGSFDDDGAPQSFWALFPWRLKEFEWRRRIGVVFDDLVRRQTLRPVSLSAVAHPEHPHASALEVVETAAGALVGVSEDEAIGTRVLTSSDIEGYALDAHQLAQEVQISLGLQGECRELSNGLWTLGQRTFQAGAAIAVFLCLRQPANTAAAVMDSEAKGRGTAVLLYPECGYNPFSLVASVACRFPHGPYDHVLERIVTQLGWETFVPPNLWSSAHLILDASKGRSWYRGVELTSLGSDTHAFKFALAVAKAQGRVVTKQELNALLSASRSDDEPAKKAKSAFVKAVAASFKAQGRTCPPEVSALITAKSGGYALQGTAKILMHPVGAGVVTSEAV